VPGQTHLNFQFLETGKNLLWAIDCPVQRPARLRASDVFGLPTANICWTKIGNGDKIVDLKAKTRCGASIMKEMRIESWKTDG